MTLEFHAPFQIDPNAVTPQQRSLQQLNETLQNAGNQFQETRYRNAMLAMQKAQAGREQAAFTSEYGSGDPLTMPYNSTNQPPTYGPQPQGTMNYSQGQSGPQPSGTLQTGMAGAAPTTYGPQPQGTLDYTQRTGFPGQTQGPQPQGALHQPGTDLSSHYMNWSQMGQPSTYDHPEMGGSGAGMPGQGGPGLQSWVNSALSNPRYGSKQRGEAAGIFKTLGEGAKSFAEAGPGVASWTPDQYTALRSGDPKQLASAFPNGIPKAAGEAGLMSGRFGQGQEFKTQDAQLKAGTEAAKNYGEFVTTDQASRSAKTALAQSQRNPAMFTTALFSVGKALGVQSRNPEMIVKAIADGDPSIAGQVSEFLSKKGAGRVTPELLSGLNQMIDTVAQSNRSAFESKATAHSAQNAMLYGGDVNQAKKSLYPGYQQWGRGAMGGGNAGGSGGDNGTGSGGWSYIGKVGQ